MIGSLHPEYCPWCHRTHYIGDARGPGYCPPDDYLEWLEDREEYREHLNESD